MDDTIYRQDAIEAINSHFGFNIEEEYGSAVQEVINGLPSAQPEIIHCKDCKWREDQNGSRAWLPCRALIVPDDFYCARAKRREE